MYELKAVFGRDLLFMCGGLGLDTAGSWSAICCSCAAVYR
ncbi:hypothetical protein CASFOL_037119 [Castilleja foliolosa]|uniref:Uncharacterized protein n=1 Tax=Castilleja foliolosa TaxID=1961234 RepID=A0ABD3BN15_9LAMI